MLNQIPGIIHGKTIELRDDPGLTDGQPVVVIVQPTTTDPTINPKTNRPWGEGILSSAGAFADEPDAERYIEEIIQSRRVESHRNHRCLE